MWVAPTLTAVRGDVRALRPDMDMLIRIVTRLDHSVDALREDVRTLWMSHGDLCRRIEVVEGREGK
jgi:hypothetical protein